MSNTSSHTTSSMPNESANMSVPVRGSARARRRRERWRRFLHDLRHTPSAMIGLVIVGMFVVLAVIGPSIAPYSPTDFDVANKFARPTFAHLFGTDSFGRDVFSRILYGPRLSLSLAAAATGISLLIATPLGLVAGYYRGWVDEILMRTTDAFLALPSIMMALLIITTLGGSSLNLILVTCIVYVPRVARVMRSGTLALRNEDFVQAAQARGESGRYIIFSEILPNTIAPLIVEASLRMGFAILLTSSLSYLGLGVSPPAPDWGLMINEARPYIFRAPQLIIFPSIVIALTIVGFNLLGDGFRDILDPRRVWKERGGEGA